MSSAMIEAPQETSLVKVNFDENEIVKIDQVASECGLMKLDAKGGVLTAVKMASGIAQLRRMLTTDVMSNIMELQGTSLGFRTDQDSKGGYSEGIVKDCLIEGLMRGARPIGNEFNIIASRTYLTKEFYTRALAEYPGLTDLSLDFGVPSIAGDKGALVPVAASWKLNGSRQSISCDVERGPDGKIIADSRIAIRVNSGMGTDAILGKAERKIRARIMSKITNTVWTEADVDDHDPAPRIVSGNGSIKDRIAANTRTSVHTESSQVDSTVIDAEFENVPSSRTEGTSEMEVKTEDAPFEAEKSVDSPAPNLPPLNDYSAYKVHDGEDAKAYHARLVSFIANADSDTLMKIYDAASEALELERLNQMRYTDLDRKIQKRHSELTVS